MTTEWKNKILRSQMSPHAARGLVINHPESGMWDSQQQPQDLLCDLTKNRLPAVQKVAAFPCFSQLNICSHLVLTCCLHSLSGSLVFAFWIFISVVIITFQYVTWWGWVGWPVWGCLWGPLVSTIKTFLLSQFNTWFITVLSKICRLSATTSEWWGQVYKFVNFYFSYFLSVV